MQRLRTVLFDRNGTAAVEFVLVFPLFVALLLPITDIAVVGFKSISAYQAMRDLGIYAQFHPPADPTNPAGLPLPTIPGYTISAKVLCGTDATNWCASQTAVPKWLSFSVNVAVTPLFVSICPLPNGCTLVYTERFQ